MVREKTSANSTVVTRTTTKTVTTNPISGSSVDLFHALEHLHGQPDAGGQELFVELGADAGGRKTAYYAAFLIDAALLENEQILEGHHFAFHAGHFGDAGDAARAVAHAGDLDNQVHRGRDLRANRVERHVAASLCDHHLQAADDVARRVGVNRGH